MTPEERDTWQKGFEAGRRAEGPCICVIGDDEETVEQCCAAHAAWRDAAVQAQKEKDAGIAREEAARHRVLKDSSLNCAGSREHRLIASKLDEIADAIERG